MCVSLMKPLSPQQVARMRDEAKARELAEEHRWTRFLLALKRKGFKRLARVLCFLGRDRVEFWAMLVAGSVALGLALLLAMVPLFLFLRYFAMI